MTIASGLDMLTVRRKLRQAARGVKYAAWRAMTRIESLSPRSNDALLPPAHLRIYYYGTRDPGVFKRACDNAKVELVSRGLQSEHRILDIGCGVGNLAIGLMDFLRAGYDGVDIHREAVSWCRHAVTERRPTFRFHVADVASVAYNAHGRAAASAYTFPFANRSFDVVFLGSVFTHMLPHDIEHYLNEIGRLLAPGGWCVASCFLLNDEVRAHVERGQSFMSFQVVHESGVCRLHDRVIPEAAVAIEESFFLQACERAGLTFRHLRRGVWSHDSVWDQDVVTLDRRS